MLVFYGKKQMIKEKSKTWALISEQLGRLFAKLPFPPNFYSWSVLPVAIAGFIAFIKGHILTGILLFLLAGIIDLIDGAVARETNQCTRKGAFLDGSLDRFVDFLLIFAYFWLPIRTYFLLPAQWIGLAIFLAIMPSFEVAYANHRQAVKDPDEKIIWRLLNRGEMYVFMLAIPFFSRYSAVFSGDLLIILVVFCFITTIQTIANTLKLSKH
jgi:phosphatidylglycerophosphate synthase